MEGHGRWQRLQDSERDLLWGLIESELRFQPYLNPKINSAELILDVKRICADFLNYSDAVDFIHRELKGIIDGNEIYTVANLLDWRHADFKLRIESDFRFSCLIDFPANGDYVFLLLNDVSNVIFSDGVDGFLYFFGESLAREVRENSKLAPYIIQQ